MEFNITQEEVNEEIRRIKEEERFKSIHSKINQLFEDSINLIKEKSNENNQLSEIKSTKDQLKQSINTFIESNLDSHKTNIELDNKDNKVINFIYFLKD